MGNWSDQLARRAAGEVPGFLGNDESLEDFADRMADEPDEEPEPYVSSTTSAAAATTAKARPRKAAAAKKRR